MTFNVVVELICRLSGIHWAAMLLMCDSVASIQLARSPTSSFADFPIYPALLTIISSAIVAAGGVTVEKLMKSHRDMSILQQSIWLYLYVHPPIDLFNYILYYSLIIHYYTLIQNDTNNIIVGE